MQKIQSTQTLPSIVAITGMIDCGPCDSGEMSGECPHCGAGGRYIWTFICGDGSRRGAMSGCIQLFPGSNSRHAKLIQEAFNRQKKAREKGQNLASWWQEMIQAAEDFASTEMEDHDSIQAATVKMQKAVEAAESKRQAWLNRNGYGRYSRRRR